MVKKWMVGLASDESESMTIREGKLRETEKLILQKIPALVKLCLKRHKSVSKLWRKKLQDFDRDSQRLRRKPRRSYSRRSQLLVAQG